MLDVLVACEFTGAIRDEFIALGHNAVSCDLLPSETPGPHIMCDVRPLLRLRWDIVIAHPPCTYLCSSGSIWSDEERDEKSRQAAEFFILCLNANAKHVAVENPVMGTYGLSVVGKPSFTVQPWMFGDNFKKRTCFWARNLPRLVPTSDLDGRTARPAVHMAGSTARRAQDRSRTYPGMARAVARQWSCHALRNS